MISIQERNILLFSHVNVRLSDGLKMLNSHGKYTSMRRASLSLARKLLPDMKDDRDMPLFDEDADELEFDDDDVKLKYAKRVGRKRDGKYIESSGTKRTKH